MQLKTLGPDFTGSWTYLLQSSAFHEFIPGTPYPAFGIALLWYKPERRLSVSVWSRARSYNVRLWGPRKLSFERN
jgi:hypothetical protein